jgi:hypothetical protein
MERLTTDIAGQLAFGQGLNTQVEDTNRAFPRAMVSMNALVNIFSECIIFDQLYCFFFPGNLFHSHSYLQYATSHQLPTSVPS